MIKQRKMSPDNKVPYGSATKLILVEEEIGESSSNDSSTNDLEAWNDDNGTTTMRTSPKSHNNNNKTTALLLFRPLVLFGLVSLVSFATVLSTAYRDDNSVEATAAEKATTTTTSLQQPPPPSARQLQQQQQQDDSNIRSANTAAQRVVPSTKGRTTTDKMVQIVQQEEKRLLLLRGTSLSEIARKRKEQRQQQQQQTSQTMNQNLHVPNSRVRPTPKPQLVHETEAHYQQHDSGDNSNENSNTNNNATKTPQPLLPEHLRGLDRDQLWDEYRCNDYFHYDDPDKLNGDGTHLLFQRPDNHTDIFYRMRQTFVDTFQPHSTIAQRLLTETSAIQVPYQVQNIPEKGFGLLSTANISKGDLIYDARHGGQVRLYQGRDFRRFMHVLPEPYMACLVLQCSTVESTFNHQVPPQTDGDQNYQVDPATGRKLFRPRDGGYIAVDIDDGCFANGASLDDNGNVDEDERNVGNSPLPGAHCTDCDYATRDIQAGEELIWSYGDYS
eukprot:CAMPEP_0168763112 /NCGR_PEP_ID=MMETSP0724-20121128/24192_1 /TAXON_ID=265536 /ORGANISM="Amphiprora sp., Strain CCMP467" /LENGTH=498 /DNA_ID=CAMNT_0008812299 /DNA_START=26 /DNA_END=1519 /DNA_ORIENTATION=-